VGEEAEELDWAVSGFLTVIMVLTLSTTDTPIGILSTSLPLATMATPECTRLMEATTPFWTPENPLRTLTAK